MFGLAAEPWSPAFWTGLIITILVGIAFFVAMFYVPPKGRGPIVAFFTFTAGLFWVLFYLVPRPFDRQPDELPQGGLETFSFFLADATATVGSISNTISAFLLGLGVYSLMRIHLSKIAKQQKDWSFSLVLMVSMVAMVIFGYWDWAIKRDAVVAAQIEAGQQNWTFPTFGRDLLFDGLLQQMDAAMFSIIAFYILSAAYRAFRVRSIEATILLASAFVMMLSLMGGVVFFADNFFDMVSGNNPAAFVNNFRLSEIAAWIRENVQNSALRAIDFGIGIGVLAMGLRIWLSLERPGMRN